MFSQSFLTNWTFVGANNTCIPGSTSSPTPSIGKGTVSLIAGTSSTFTSDTTGSCSASASSFGWNTANYPAQGTLSGTAGVMFAVSTVGKSNIGITIEHQASGTALRFARFEYSTDGGLTWTSAGINNGSLLPHGTFVLCVVNLSSCLACNNNSNLRFRIVSIFSTFAFNENATNTSPSGFYAPNTNYMRANADAKFLPDPGDGTGAY